MQPTNLAENDPRMLRELNEAFPESSHFNEFLRTSILAFGGTLSVACFLIRRLKCWRGIGPPISEEAVARLSVYMDAEATIKVHDGFPEDDQTREQFIQFGILLQQQINGLVQEPRHGIDPDHMDGYWRLFICASAMYLGLKVDPRSKVA